MRRVSKGLLAGLVAGAVALSLGTVWAASQGRPSLKPRTSVVSSAKEAAARHLDTRLRELASRGGGTQVPVLVVTAKGAKTPSQLIEPLRVTLRGAPDKQFFAGRVRVSSLEKLATSRGVLSVLDNGRRTPPKLPEKAAAKPTVKQREAIGTRLARARASGASRRFAAQFDGRGVVTATAAGSVAGGSKASGGAPTSWYDTGYDHRSDQAWANGYTGKGVIVGVADSGVDFAHPDLQSAYATVPAGAWNAGWPLALDSYSLLTYALDRVYRDPSMLTYEGGAGQWSWYSVTTTTVQPSGGYVTFRGNRYKVPSGPKASKSGRYHIGWFNDMNLAVYLYGRWTGDNQTFLGPNHPAVLVVDPNVAGVYDTVYVDLSMDPASSTQDFTDEKPVTKASPLSYADVWDNTAGREGQDGIPDISGGMLYYIADGAHHPPGYDMFYGALPVSGTASKPSPYRNGELVAFMGAFDDVYDGADHGTLCASAVAARGNLDGPSIDGSYPSFRSVPATNGAGLVQGAGRNAHVAAIGDIYNALALATLQAYDFAAYGLDGKAGSRDELQVLSNSYGESSTDNDEWDFASRYVTALNATDATSTAFVFSTGNGGPGYGTRTGPAPSSAISVGASTQFGAGGGFDSIDSAGQITSDDVIPFSNRGPTSMGHLAPHVVADGAFAPGDLPLNELPTSTDAVADWTSWENWGGTSRSCPVAAGNLSLVYDAYRKAHGRWPTWSEARTLLMSGADDLSYDPLVQGAGKVDAARSTDLAAGKAGLRLGRDAWYPGDFRGRKADGFASVIATGESDKTSLTITNEASSALSGTIGAKMYQRFSTTTLNVVIDPSKESPYDFDRPDWLQRLDPSIPPGTELMVVRASFPFSEFDPSADYGTGPDSAPTVNSLRLLAYDWTDKPQGTAPANGTLWTDKNGNGSVNAGEIDPNEYMRFTYCYNTGTTQEIRVQNPLARRHSGVYLGVQHKARTTAAKPIHVRLEIGYWKKADWDWLDTPPGFSLAAKQSASIPMTFSVPATATLGTYEGQVDFSWGAAASQRVVFPVVASVAATSTHFHFGDDGTPASAQPLLSNGRVLGFQDWAWRAESGDWRFFSSDVPTVAAGSSLLVRTDWDAVNTDIDTLLYGPVPSAISSPALSGLLGPYDLGFMGGSGNSNVTDGIWRFQTGTGGPSEWVAGTLGSGLNTVMLHNVVSRGASIETTFTGQTGRVAVVPQRVTLTTAAGSGTTPVRMQSELALPDLAASVRGLTRAVDQVRPVPALYDEYVQNLTPDPISDAAWIDVAVSTKKGTDIDLFLERYIGSGPRDDPANWQLVGSSAGGTGDEHLRVTAPQDGSYRVVVATFGGVVGGSDTFSMHISAPSGADAVVTGVPGGAISANTTYTLNVNWTKNRTPLAARHGTYEGVVFLGPSAAPAAVQVPVSLRYPLTLGYVKATRMDGGMAERDTALRFALSKRIDTSTVNATTVKLTAGATTVAWRSVVGETPTEALGTITPTTSLRPSTTYTLKLHGVKSVDGDVLPDVTFTFKTTPLDFARLKGGDRYKTAVAISGNAFPAGASPFVVIARGDKFADALTASSLCGELNAPLLLTKPTSLPASVSAEITRLGAVHAVIIGDRNAVSTSVETSIAKAMAKTSPRADTRRLGGRTRYETAAAVARAVMASSTVNPWKAAFIARGDQFPDALAASPIAFAQRIPILLTEPKSLPATTSATAKDLGIKRLYVLGGTGSVSDGVKKTLASAVGSWETTRVWGNSRFLTAIAIRDFALKKAFTDEHTHGVARSDDFPDALGGAVWVGRKGGVLLLTTTSPLQPDTKAAIKAHTARVRSLRIFGGAITEPTFNEIKAQFP